LSKVIVEKARAAPTLSGITRTAVCDKR